MGGAKDGFGGGAVRGRRSAGPFRAAVLAALAALPAPGCYLSHGDEDASEADADTAADVPDADVDDGSVLAYGVPPGDVGSADAPVEAEPRYAAP